MPGGSVSDTQPCLVLREPWALLTRWEGGNTKDFSSVAEYPRAAQDSAPWSVLSGQEQHTEVKDCPLQRACKSVLRKAEGPLNLEIVQFVRTWPRHTGPLGLASPSLLLAGWLCLLLPDLLSQGTV